jgi:hypothetical protein
VSSDFYATSIVPFAPIIIKDLYTRKSVHIADRIQRMQRINEIAIVIGAPIAWALYAALGMPYGGRSCARHGWG